MQRIRFVRIWICLDRSAGSLIIFQTLLQNGSLDALKVLKFGINRVVLRGEMEIGGVIVSILLLSSL